MFSIAFLKIPKDEHDRMPDPNGKSRGLQGQCISLLARIGMKFYWLDFALAKTIHNYTLYNNTLYTIHYTRTVMIKCPSHSNLTVSVGCVDFNCPSKGRNANITTAILRLHKYAIKKAKNREISIYLSANACVALCHVPTLL